MNRLAKDTVIYGLSSIIGKFLNWLLVPLYTYVLKQQSDYGIVTDLYAWTALLLVILTYGMETGFFRFVNKKNNKANIVYTTAMTALFVTSFIFALGCVMFCDRIALWLNFPHHSDFILLLGIVVAMDAFCSIPFAYLRFKGRAMQFASLKLLFVFLNIFFNIFFLVLCPKISDWSLISFWYNADYGVGYVFVANILATTVQTLFLLPTILAERWQFSGRLLKQMLHYSLPLLILGICGIMNQTLDRILFRHIHPAILTKNPAILTLDYDMQVQAELGIYGACFKVAMVMMMFTQAFRYAYEPFVFAKQKDQSSLTAYADAMKYYVISSYLIMLGMIVFLDILKYIISPSYWEGLIIIPIVLWAYVFQGIYFNLSFWYKLTDKTYWGAIFSTFGLMINLAVQIVLVPRIGYLASALGSAICFFVLMIGSFVIGQRFLYVPYNLRRIGLYSACVVLMLGAYYVFAAFINDAPLLKMGFGCVLLLIFCYLCFQKDLYVLWNSRRNGSITQN